MRSQCTKCALDVYLVLDEAIISDYDLELEAVLLTLRTSTPTC